MGKRTKERLGKKERRRAESAALARSTWMSQSDGRSLGDGPMRSAVPPVGSAQAREATASPSPDLPPAPTRPVAEPGELAARLAALSTVLQRGLARADAGEGLTRARLSALSLLVLGGPRTLGDLAAAERVRPPTMTRLVHAMERDGLVVREPHPTDGRSIVIRASVAGERLLEQERSRQLAPLAAAIADLDAPERAQLDEAADLLGRVLRRARRERPAPMA